MELGYYGFAPSASFGSIIQTCHRGTADTEKIIYLDSESAVPLWQNIMLAQTT